MNEDRNKNGTWYLTIQGYDRSQSSEEAALERGLAKYRLDGATDGASAFAAARSIWERESARGFELPDGRRYPRNPRVVLAFAPDWPDAPRDTALSRAVEIVAAHPGVLTGPYRVGSTDCVVAAPGIGFKSCQMVVEWLAARGLRPATRQEFNLASLEKIEWWKIDTVAYLFEITTPPHLRYIRRDSITVENRNDYDYDSGFSKYCSFLAAPIDT